MNILLLGATGQIGHALRHTLLPLGRVWAPPSREIDLSDLEGLWQALRASRPDVIVNAAAYTRVDQAEGEPTVAHRVNAEAVEVLAAYAREHGAMLMHYSTDYVFDGTQTLAYRETDAPAPLNAYGHSKWAGEQAILGSGCRALVLRTSWVYAAHGRNFVRTILGLARERDALSVVADQLGAPTLAERVAHVSAQALAASLQTRLPDGLYHLSAMGRASWYDVAYRTVAQAQRLGMPLRLRPENITAIRAVDHPLPARRPSNSLLDNRLLSEALSLALPDWTVDLDRTLLELARQCSE